MVKEFVVSTGADKTSTPIGEFRTYNKSLVVYSWSAKCWLPFWIAFDPEGKFGFHEVPICGEGRRGLEKLGKPASKGCVHHFSRKI